MKVLKNRIEWIDISKAIGIILVVLGHCISHEFLITKLIYACHMPLFFIISGICSNYKSISFLSFLKKRSCSLIIPLICFTFIISILSKLFIGYNFNLLQRGFPHALWFLFILFVAENISFIYSEYFKKENLLIGLIIISLFLGNILKHNDIYIRYSLSSTFYALAYYNIGRFLKTSNYLSLILNNKYVVLLILLIILSPVYFFLVVSYDININLQDNNITPLFIGFFTSILGSLIIIILSKLLNKKTKTRDKLIWLGQNTLVIMCVHLFFSVLFQQYCKNFFLNMYIYKIFHISFVFALSILCCLIINKYFRFMLGNFR